MRMKRKILLGIAIVICGSTGYILFNMLWRSIEEEGFFGLGILFLFFFSLFFLLDSFIYIKEALKIAEKTADEFAKENNLSPDQYRELKQRLTKKALEM
ncbi:hypothetical protein IPM65_02230 [Candidatus Roizmanbacteria bacterium]|nr:MAG: hypothetical protein IPM65_02230 [Candidatus Roizmanbacteria bacterium]